MIHLKATQKLQALLAGAVATLQPSFYVAFYDHAATTYGGNNQLGNLNDTTVVDICAAPTGATVRQVTFLQVRNRDSAAIVLTILLDVAGTDYELFKVQLETLETLTWVQGVGWQVLAADGSAKGTGGGGSAVNRSYAEVPNGVIDGSNMVYTLDNTPFPEDSLTLFRNGLLQTKGVDFEISDAEITYTLPMAVDPEGDDAHVCWYEYA